MKECKEPGLVDCQKSNPQLLAWSYLLLKKITLPKIIMLQDDFEVTKMILFLHPNLPGTGDEYLTDEYIGQLDIVQKDFALREGLAWL